MTIGTGASLSVGPVPASSSRTGETLTDDGTLSFATGDIVTLDANCCYVRCRSSSPAP